MNDREKASKGTAQRWSVLLYVGIYLISIVWVTYELLVTHDYIVARIPLALMYAAGIIFHIIRIVHTSGTARVAAAAILVFLVAVGTAMALQLTVGGEIAQTVAFFGVPIALVSIIIGIVAGCQSSPLRRANQAQIKASEVEPFYTAQLK